MTNDVERAMAESFRDAVGQEHRRAGNASPPRIVSLVPSLTELLFDLGLGARVVGRTAYCIHPKGAVGAVPVVGGTKKVSMQRLLAQRPTHALVNVDENPKAMAEELARAGVEVIVTHPCDPRDNLELYRMVGGLFGADETAEEMCARFERAYRALVEAARAWPVRRVLYLIWKEPWMTVRADTYIARTLALARIEAVGGEGEAARYPVVAIDQALLARLDAVLFPSEPYAFDEREVERFRQEYGCPPRLRLKRIDGEIASWYGSRTIVGLERLAEFAATF